MGDPFSCIEHECGEPERDSSDDAYTIVVSPSSAALGGATPSPTPHADAPIFMCSLPDSPCAASDGDDRGGGFSNAPVPNPRERDPVTPPPELALTSSGGLKRKSRVCSTRSRGCTIRSSVSPQETPTRGNEVLGFGKSRNAETSKEDAAVPMNPSLEEIEKFRNRPLETLQDASGAVPSQRMLPDSVLKPPTEEGNAGRRLREKAEARPPPANLRDCVDMLSSNIDAKFGDMDIVNVARRRGVAFSDPPWWAPGVTNE
ncbi:hypothetical protein ACMD2_12813 [Ananas comosus]|uniref:Uncharacterized protein n=1 Tax=Ananas comosus TaxID=4615 RepID=A0A199V659_ANACO|nr:hypothetical protein ACMD2_12813 [Ananas comosus]